MRVNYHPKIWSVLVSTALITGCVTPISPELEMSIAEARWQRSDVSAPASNEWLDEFADASLASTVDQAIDNNYALAQTRYQLEQSWATLATTKAVRLPSVSLTIDGSTRRIGAGPQNNNFGGNAGGDAIDSFGLGLDIRWQADIWGELSAATRAAALTFAAQEAGFLDQRRRLVADVSRSWFNLAAANEQVAVAKEQLTNARQSLDIVEGGYRSGLNEALDLYLARNATAQAENNLRNREQLALEAATTLQLLAARNPGKALMETPTLIDADAPIGFGVPSEMVTRRGDLQQAWLNLLSANADLAVAHKQRFPSLNLVASASDSADKFIDVFDGQPLGWVLLGTLVQPVFEGGRLKAISERARARVLELEQRYLELVNAAFGEVENAISRRAALNARYTAAEQALNDAETALTLSLEQYQRGLVNYATVLESQQRAFDARVGVVDLRNQKLQNRIDLHQALGGSYGAEDQLEASL
ncbi:MAG: efflux transporter outer membrane subunit [Woeseiaceae bacterium]